jgi:hypothetical protein
MSIRDLAAVWSSCKTSQHDQRPREGMLGDPLKGGRLHPASWTMLNGAMSCAVAVPLLANLSASASIFTTSVAVVTLVSAICQRAE